MERSGVPGDAIAPGSANFLTTTPETGATIREYLERIVAHRPLPRAHVSGVTVHYDSSAAATAGSRVSRVIMADGRPLDDARVYKLIVNDFLATGDDGLGLAGRALSAEPLGIEDLQALIDYLQQLPQPVTPPTQPRLIPAR